VQAISSANPLPPLPAGFQGARILLRFAFAANSH
jgi:hypothetical protein